MINYAGKAGTEKYVENLVRIFSAAGENCHFAYNLPGELSDKMEKRGIPSFRLTMGRANALSAAKKLADYCRENGIEVIHAQYPRENITALLSKRFYDVPRVVYTNHLTIHTGLRWRILNRLFTKHDHRIIAVCREGRDIMIQNGVCPERIEVIYNGVEPAGESLRDRTILAELGVPPNAFVMSILARYEPEKGLDFLLDCMVRLRELTDEPFVCLICGDGSGYAATLARIAELGLSDIVLPLGYRTDTHRILCGSDLYLNFSERNEAMSFAILEAMNTGLPCVVTDVGGNRDLAETDIRCGTVVNFGDVDAFSAAILSLMEDDAKRAEYSAAALRKITEGFDLNKLAWDVFRAYQ
ncbi:MAG: glycosyltransferase [Oscillospiraceae bacterium]